MKLRTYLGIGALVAATAIGAYKIDHATFMPEFFPDMFGTNERMKERYVDIASNIDKAKSYLAYCKGEDAESKSDGVCILLRQRGIVQEQRRSAHVWKFPDLEKYATDVEKKIDDHLIDDHFKLPN
jgi:hypothetical protein